MPHHSPNFSAARATARSPCQWNTRCSAVGERISGSALLRPMIVTEVSISLDPGEHIGDEVAIGKGGGVARLGQLVVGGAVDIVEHRPGQALLGQQAEIVDVVAIGQAHGRGLAADSRAAQWSG